MVFGRRLPRNRVDSRTLGTTPVPTRGVVDFEVDLGGGVAGIVDVFTLNTADEIARFAVYRRWDVGTCCRRACALPLVAQTSTRPVRRLPLDKAQKPR